ncbi:hypothetical protein V6N12_020331 [Hibiscus sabdariffa]|uniref:Uncharacterized protein n=1 Tax=Hibiscus sabdariffa TaxID=183260 RepID=A0ABR2B283_9ROSI
MVTSNQAKDDPADCRENDHSKTGMTNSVKPTRSPKSAQKSVSKPFRDHQLLNEEDCVSHKSHEKRDSNLANPSSEHSGQDTLMKES